MKKCPHCKRTTSHKHSFLLLNSKIIKDDDFEVKNGKATPYYSSAEIWHDNQRVGVTSSSTEGIKLDAEYIKKGYSTKIELYN